MELEKFDRQLRLMVLLATNRNMTVDEISKELNMGRRSIYRYIDTFRSMGFIIEKHSTKYRISNESPFFTDITKQIHFSKQEAACIAGLLNATLKETPELQALREKLAFLYDVNSLRARGIGDHNAENLATLYKAVKQERLVVLRGYESPASGAASDRVVEPYLFLPDTLEVRCYELATGMNKTFAIDRIGSVEILDLLWAHRAMHSEFYTDLFHFSGERRFRVRLLMGPVANGLLQAGFPEARKLVTLSDDGRYELDTLVCSYTGVGRFVLGVFDDVEVVDSPEFDAYLEERIRYMQEKMAAKRAAAAEPQAPEA